MKRTFDILFSFCVLMFFLPFGIIISTFIFLNDFGNVFYRQERIGKNEAPFYLLKFRTMKKDADKLGKLTVGMSDQRITKVGYFLRKTKLDEFPQFVNVLKGEMSVVGPRPEVQEYVALYTREQKKILQVKPGITDYASIEYYKENELLGQAKEPRQIYIEKIMPDKIELNKRYLKNPTLRHDLKIIWMTLQKMLRK